jgi:hypothetical protein
MFTHRSTRALSALLLTSAAACGSDAPTGEWGGEAVDSAGISMVHNPAEGIWAPTEGWTFEETLRIGSLDGPAALQFGAVAGVAIDSRGQVYVLDQQAGEVRVFDDGGQHVLTMGRPGSGPGELSQAAAGVFVGSGDTILVPDLLNSRVTRFAPGGEGVTGVPLQLTSGIPVRWELRGDGHLLAQLRGMPVPGMAALEGGDPVVAFDSDGSVVDTAFVLPQGQTFSATGGAPRIRLFEAEPVWDMDPSGDVTWAMNSEFRLHRQTPGGPVQLIATMPRERRPVSETDRTVIRRAIRSLLEDQGIPPQAMDQVLQGIEFGEQYPVVANLLSGPGGTTLVQRPQTPEEMQALADAGTFDIQNLGSRIWDVFDAEGRFLGPVEFPGRFVPLQAYGDGFVGLDRDEMDVQSVVTLRVIG